MTIVHIVFLDASFLPMAQPVENASMSYRHPSYIWLYTQFKPDVDQAAIDKVRSPFPGVVSCSMNGSWLKCMA